MKRIFLFFVVMATGGVAEASLRNHFSNLEVLSHVLVSPTLSQLPELRDLELNVVLVQKSGEDLSSRFEVILKYTTYFPDGQNGVPQTCSLSAHVSVQKRQTVIKPGGPILISSGLSVPRFTRPECGE